MSINNSNIKGNEKAHLYLTIDGVKHELYGLASEALIYIPSNDIKEK